MSLLSRLIALETTLATLYPARIVTRDAFILNEPKRIAALAGVYSVVSSHAGAYRTTTFDSVSDGWHYVVVIGRIELATDATGSAVEDAELTMIEEIKALLRRTDLPEELTGGEMLDWQQSKQQVVPEGWVVVNLRFMGA